MFRTLPSAGVPDPGEGPHVQGDGPRARAAGAAGAERRTARLPAAAGGQLDVEDILVNGPPWRTRVALRVVAYVPGPNGDGDGDEYANRAVAYLDLRWGRLVTWEDYEDTERVAVWDSARAAVPSASASC
jgi:hypothetical protein